MKARRAETPRISAPLLAFFRRVAGGYFRREFHGVRISGADRLRESDGPLIVYANHSSWWDPMMAFLLAWKLLPRRKHYAPMDASALDRYPIFKRLGVFPVEMNSPRGGIQFLRTSEAALRSGGVLWVTPQGRFVDPRQRPLEFRPGLASLAVRTGSCRVLPLAIEYSFWDERLPEALLHFGEPIQVTSGAAAEEVEAQLIAALEAAMEQLKCMAMTRDPRTFPLTLVRGRVGTGGFYALGQRLTALLRGEPYRPEHTVQHDESTAGAVGEWHQ